MDALALGVPTGAGVGLADEVLLRVAGHLRRRPRLHRPPGDVPPVAAPVLLQPLQKQPAPYAWREGEKILCQAEAGPGVAVGGPPN
jgi:hypothetical protein